MKQKSIFKILAFSAISSIGLMSCADEVLVKTEDTTAADAIIADMEEATTLVYTLDQENASLRIENEQLENLIDSLNSVRNNLQYSSSNPTEVHYTVSVISAANAEFSGSRSKGVAGATVVVEQDGVFHQPSSSAEGLYLFTGIKPGYVYVTVSAPEHTTVEYQAYTFINGNDDVAGAQAYNASTQVTLYPNAGSSAGTIYGKAYANTSVVNDTANRFYGSNATIYGTRSNTYITQASVGDDTNLWSSNFYQTNSSSNVIYENATANHKIYARPTLNNNVMPNPSVNGYTTMVTYKGIITSATVAADGSYTLPVIATSGTDNLISDITVFTEDFVADHTRFTTFGANHIGQTKEAGDTTRITLKWYNNTNAAQSVFTGNGTTSQSLNANNALSVKRLTIKEKWQYRGYFLEYGDRYTSAFEIDDLPTAGEKMERNVFFWPNQKL